VSETGPRTFVKYDTHSTTDNSSKITLFPSSDIYGTIVTFTFLVDLDIIQLVPLQIRREDCLIKVKKLSPFIILYSSRV
jgi:hypothetical protein